MILLFYGVDAAAAKDEAAKRRADKQPTRATECYACRQAEPCNGIEFTDDVPEFERDRLNTLFGATPAADGYASMKITELKALAAEREVDLGDATKKADVIAALELADEAAKAAQ